MSEEIKVHCTDKGMDVNGYILNHNPEVFMDVAINTVKVKLTYNKQFNQYVGSMAGLEWIVTSENIPKDIPQFKR